MSEELVPTQTQAVVTQVPGTTDISATALAPDEMVQAQSALVRWCKDKIEFMKQELKELVDARAVAVKRKWAAAPLDRQVKRCEKRVDFYKRMEQALAHGYVIVPNFPVTAFAIRTNREAPLKMLTTSWGSSHEQGPAMLPQGEGEYQNPFPTIWEKKLEDKTKEPPKKFSEYYCDEWKELEFPLVMAKPNIMEATNRAMALKIFDDLAIVPGRRTTGDPIIVARLKDPRSTKYNQKWVSFLIAWNLDTREL